MAGRCQRRICRLLLTLMICMAPQSSLLAETVSVRLSVTFSDNNPMVVPVQLECSDGTVESELTEVGEDQPLTATISGIEDAAIHCIVSVRPVAGYSASYYAFDDARGESRGDPDGCEFVGFVDGDAGFCEVEMSLQPSRVRVTREWVEPRTDITLTLYDEARYGCDSEAWGEYEGSLWFSGAVDTQTFEVLPDWEHGTSCTVWAVGLEASVAYENEECRDLLFRPGDAPTCTLYHTRVFDPDQPEWWYGWAFMAVIVLAIGAVAGRLLSRS
jgi:hypothetical protein